MSFYFFGLEITMRHYLYIVQVLLAEGMFAVNFRRREHFWQRLIPCIVAYFVLALVIPALINPYFYHNLFIVFLLSLPIFPICFKNVFWDMFFCCIAAINIQNLSYMSASAKVVKVTPYWVPLTIGSSIAVAIAWLVCGVTVVIKEKNVREVRK